MFSVSFFSIFMLSKLRFFAVPKLYSSPSETQYQFESAVYDEDCHHAPQLQDDHTTSPPTVCAKFTMFS